MAWKASLRTFIYVSTYRSCPWKEHNIPNIYGSEVENEGWFIGVIITTNHHVYMNDGSLVKISQSS